MNDISECRWIDKDSGMERTLKVLGPRLLVRRCERNEKEFIIQGAGNAGTREGELMTQSMRQYGHTHWCEVLAIGEGARNPRTYKGMVRYEMSHESEVKTGKTHIIPWGIKCDFIAPGDFVVVPENSAIGELYRGVCKGYEFEHETVMIDITDVIAWMRYVE